MFAGASSENADPSIVVEATCFFDFSRSVVCVLVSPVASGTSIGVVVIKLDEKSIEFDLSNSKAHVVFWKGTLRSSGNKVSLAWVQQKLLTEGSNTSNVALLKI